MVNTGRRINSDQYEGVATVSLDGRYLYFNRDKDIYWISARIIEDLRPIKRVWYSPSAEAASAGKKSR